ncbi:uracil-DNA glycosylase [Rhodoplanes sp. SY1]|uniref:uracil-DNA glycosylase n=1 Tax=Rhodoplanes sp. SY1 TaxID=3166646 RepID=UPI0038B5157C
MPAGRACARPGLGVWLGAEPGRDCPRCPRLVDFRETWRAKKPDWENAPVPSFGPAAARLLIVGLAPGLQGANRTGRPFTGDYAGDLLYATLKEFGFARGTYEARPDDGLTLIDARITNAVRCVPPENKPTGPEITTCRPFLVATMAEMPNLAAIVALGRIAHDTLMGTLGWKKSAHPFGHGAVHAGPSGGAAVFDSYHCSRYNTNTGVLTPDMFRAVFSKVRAHLADAPPKL